MKYYLLLIIFLIGFNLTFSQFLNKKITSRENSFNIKIELPQEVLTLDNSNKTFRFDEQIDVSRPGAPILPNKIIYVAIPPESKIFIKINKKEFTQINDISPEFNPQVEAENDSILTYKKVEIDKKYLLNDIYPKELIEVVGYTWIRDYYCAIIQINSAQYNWKNKELFKINKIDFDLNYEQTSYKLNNNSLGDFDKNLSKLIFNYDEAISFRSYQQNTLDSTGSWIDYTKEYIKLQVDKDGIYKITYDDLNSYGISPLMINPKQLKIYYKGKEIPIYVKGEDDLSFNTEDYIEFYGSKNYGFTNYESIVQIGQDYKNYWDRYTDTSYYWMQWEVNNGQRCLIENFNPDNYTDTLKYHVVKQHFEQDQRIWYSDASIPRTQLPFWQEHKFWTWFFLDTGGLFNLNFVTNDVLPNSLVKINTRIKSNAGNITSNTHKIGFGLNSTAYSDTVTMNFKETKNAPISFSSTVLNQNNTFKIYNFPTQATVNQILIDWIDVEYYRLNVAVNDSLLLTIPNNFNKNASIIEVNNINSIDSNAFVYKVYPEFKKIGFTKNSQNIIRFADTISEGDKYLIVNNNFKYTPKYLYKKQFVNLRNLSNGADYIIISNKVLQSSAENYKNFISSTYNQRTSLLYVDDIYDEFSFGFPNAESLKDFLYYAYQYWVAPHPSYLLLAGDANYDYKNVMYSPIRRNNLVPSFGMPVSDVWFTTFDSTNLNLQQMYVGRIPANNNSELQRYLNKHQSYVSRQYNDWNKKYLFFSGGDSRNPSELSQIKAANDEVYMNLVLPAPTGGISKHFYKTISPPSNFGPFTPEQVQETISNSGLFISYIGHSGTQTWDNGITSVEDIKNSYPDRFPLISDFGCSTGKFAEPDVDAFGELFTSEHIDGQAISYLGNSSLGFLTTSLRFPKYFYQYFLLDTLTVVGQVHFLAKVKQFNLTGVSDVNKVFNYCNLLFGDPIISLPIPKKPNFIIKNSFITINGEQPNDLQDSLEIKLILKNEGLVLNDSLNISLSDTWRDSITFTQVFKYPIPLNDDTIYLRIPCKNKSGLHLLRVELDKNDLFPEIYENDNTAELNYIVYTSSVRPIINDHYYATLIDSLDILNAQYKLNNSIERIKIQLADNKDFINPLEFNRNYDTLKTKVNFENLIPEKRYWWRAKIDNNETNWSENFSFTTFTNRWYLDKLFNLDDIEFSKIYFDSTSSGFKIANRENLLKLKSAGWLDGSYASLLYNHQEYITNTFFAGIATGLIDTTTLNPSDIRYFNNPDSMISYLTNLPNGTLIAMMAAADPVQYVLGWSPGTPIRNLIKTFGSAKVDSIMYRDSWCMIGKKGAPIGSVPEAFKKSQTGFVSIDSTKWSYLMDGSITTPIIANSSSWLNVTKRDSLPEGSNLEIIPIGINKNGSIDTLVALSFNDSIADINFIDSSKYSKIKLLAKFNANQNYDSPVLYSLGVNYNLLPELTTNYQVVHLSKDSLMQGDSLEIGFRVVNVSETKSDSFNIHLNIIRPDNSTFSILDTSITSLLPNKNISLNEKYISNLYDGFGLFKYNIVIDVYNNVNEIYEDNNIYSGTFNIKKDTTTSVNEADVNVSFDGLNILDGDLVSSKPNININVHYPIWYPVNDSTSFEIYIDDVKCSPDNMSLNYDTIKRSLDIKLSPEFKTGEHYIRVFMKNNLGRIEENARYDRFFNVYDEFKVLDVFNYPNPFKQKTSFTFNLTENDVKVHIKIYTVAGRLIKEIYPNDLLKVGFNNIEWDGKDQDGDEVSNGVYLYKVIIEKDGKTDTKIQKLSKVK